VPLTLALFASQFVLVLGGLANMLDLVPVSLIPTFAAVTALERWTRAPRELPLARAR
jgi:hypothetical protein